MLFSACCIASCEPAQIHGSISNMKMEIQKKIWTSRYEKRDVNCGFHAYKRINSMRGSRNICQGVQARWPENSLDKVFFYFFSPQLILQFTEGVQWFITEKTILFQGSRGSPTFSGGGGGGPASSGGGGVQMLISIEPHITCDFPGGPDLLSPPPLVLHMIRGAVKTDRKQEFEYVDRQTCICRVLKRRIFDNEHCFVTTRFIYFL